MQKGSSLKPLAVSLPLPETFFHHSFVRSLTFGHVAIVCNEDQYLQRAVPPVASFTQRRGGGEDICSSWLHWKYICIVQLWSRKRPPSATATHHSTHLGETCGHLCMIPGIPGCSTGQRSAPQVRPCTLPMDRRSPHYRGVLHLSGSCNRYAPYFL
jgi:hypothetical protein